MFEIDEKIIEEYRPYNDSEVSEAIKRVVSDALFEKTVRYFIEKNEYDEFVEKVKHITTVDAFQYEVMYKALCRVLQKTSRGNTSIGVEKLSPNKSYTYISNHRDIVLDAALLQNIFYDHKIKTSEITFGSNLMKPQFITDIGKINKMFKIIRGGSVRDIFTNSQNVSSYMRYAITQKNTSTWIAQRDGRTKDGNDTTQIAVLKMFAMSSTKHFSENLSELNITPIAVSYEYEPCIFRKTKEIYISKREKYIKSENEDIASIIEGIVQYKGEINHTICPTIRDIELEECSRLPKTESFKMLAQIIDKRIYKGYKLYKTNYMAFDLKNNTRTFVDRYTDIDKANFELYMQKGLATIEGDRDELKEIFLNIYANPVENSISNNT